MVISGDRTMPAANESESMSLKRCTCGEPREALALACPKCRVLYSDADRANEEQLSEQEKRLVTAVRTKLIAPIVFLFTLFSILTGGGIYQIWSSLHSAVYSRIDEQFSDPRIRETFVSVANERAETMMAEELRPELDAAKRQLETELAQFKNANTFSLTVLAAQADSRDAFDQLEVWAKDSTFEMQEFALAAWISILDAHSQGFWRSGFTPRWPPGVEGSRLTVDELRLYFESASADDKPALLEAVWKREDIPKGARLQFMIDVMERDRSLKAVEYAGRHFTQGTELKIKPLAVKHLSAWWAANKAKYR